jgi:hypothetical protein
MQKSKKVKIASTPLPGLSTVNVYGSFAYLKMFLYIIHIFGSTNKTCDNRFSIILAISMCPFSRAMAVFQFYLDAQMGRLTLLTQLLKVLCVGNPADFHRIHRQSVTNGKVPNVKLSKNTIFIKRRLTWFSRLYLFLS